MANHMTVKDTNSYITWQTRGTVEDGDVMYLTLRSRDGKPIAKAKLTSDQLHRFICMHNTMK